VRLVHGESDGLPGLMVDRYGDTLVAQFTSAGTERWKGVMADALLQATGLSAPVRALGRQRAPAGRA
jgi:23S rRNA (cytosine1962-C5)-methyltransferase